MKQIKSPKKQDTKSSVKKSKKPKESINTRSENYSLGSDSSVEDLGASRTEADKGSGFVSIRKSK